MLQTDCDKLDPRIRRTRHLLQEALRRLLEEKEFEKISVQDITDAATLNRATFYAHYPDKFALLEESIRVSFLQLLQKRNVKFDGTCPSAFRAIILAVCDYLAGGQTLLPSKQHQFEPFLQATVIDQVREVLMEGFRRHSDERISGQASGPRISPETIAATASWAIYGAAKQWVNTASEERLAQDEFVEIAIELIQPILTAGSEESTPAEAAEKV